MTPPERTLFCVENYHPHNLTDNLQMPGMQYIDVNLYINLTGEKFSEINLSQAALP